MQCVCVCVCEREGERNSNGGGGGANEGQHGECRKMKGSMGSVERMNIHFTLTLYWFLFFVDCFCFKGGRGGDRKRKKKTFINQRDGLETWGLYTYDKKHLACYR